MARTLEPQPFAVPENGGTIMSYWERFMAGDGDKPPLIRDLIDHSWRRCQQGQVDYRRDQAPPPMGEDRLCELKTQHRDLLEAAAPIMVTARDFLAETGTVMVLTDAKGTVLSVAGDQSLALKNATEKIHLLPGADWSELTCGTNAIGTALQTGLPVQVHAEEHFCYGIKPWTCSAAVIRDPFDRTLLGVIDLSGLRNAYSRHSMALIVEAASRIETQLAQIELEYRYRLLERCCFEVPNQTGDLVVILDRFGRPITTNGASAAELRGLGVARRSNPQTQPHRLPKAGDNSPGGGGGRDQWLKPVFAADEHLGSVLIVPRRPGRSSGARRTPGREAAPPPREHPLGADTPTPAAAEIIGEDPRLRQALDRVLRVAPTTAPVLLVGETGVGKELFAKSVHEASPVAHGPFIALNCGGLSRDLLASELFGYAEGAFTGARKGGMVGKIEAAHGGTLFLDEIGEMPLDLQPLLLRVLEEREIYRVGEVQPRRVDFRLVAATHRNLRHEVAEGRFRGDLFYRLAVVQIAIPRLRDRVGDIPGLIEHLCHQATQRYGLLPRPWSPAALERLRAYDWPGNVRELRNVVESVLLTTPGAVITPADLPPEVRGDAVAPGSDPSTRQALSPQSPTTLEAVEREQIWRSLHACRGNVTATARHLGLAKSTLYAKLKRYAIDPQSLRRDPPR